MKRFWLTRDTVSGGYPYRIWAGEKRPQFLGIGWDRYLYPPKDILSVREFNKRYPNMRLRPGEGPVAVTLKMERVG